jgi:Protein of unknown function (DUF1648)
MRLVRETLALLGLVFQIAVVRYFWDRMPREVPTHFNGLGTPDAYGDKTELLIVPVIALFLYAMISTLSFFPQLFNYPVTVTDQNRGRLQALAVAMLGWLKAQLTWTFAYIVWGSVRVAAGASSGLSIAFLPVMLLLVGGTVVWNILRMRRLA